jgi:hypothetical protein
MRIILEVHRYAPELNTAYVGPTRTPMRVPGCTSIRAARGLLFPILTHRGRYVVLRSDYQRPEHAYLNSTRQGFCNDLRSLGDAIRAFRARLHIDAEHKPVLHIKTRLIG